MPMTSRLGDRPQGRATWRALVLAVALCVGLGTPGLAGVAAEPREVVVDGLSGTLLAPAGPSRSGGRTGVVIITGSGPIDRDGASPQGVDTNTYRALAETLAQAGIVSLRYDKRGVAKSASALASGEAGVTVDTFVADAVRMTEHLRAQPGITRVVLAGHSEGAVIAMLAAARTPVDALVLLAAPGRPLGAILRDQLARQPLPGEVGAEAARIITALENGQDVGPVAPPLDQLFRPSVLPFVRSLINIEPARLLAARREPVLLIGAGRDIQISRMDFDALAASRADLASHWEAEATHTLKMARTDDPAQVRAYSDPTLPLSPGIASSMIEFLQRLRP